ncbi:hypothetical protein BRC77_05250 [Halobacteriales archaeon QH_8_64_26]|nr:MAG: hypothetical protein BRC77_05250 [Halobacteriales archaeon QH_8_64_26]
MKPATSEDFDVVAPAEIELNEFDTVDVPHLLNRSDEETHRWIAIGTPPVGTARTSANRSFPRAKIPMGRTIRTPMRYPYRIDAAL